MDAMIPVVLLLWHWCATHHGSLGPSGIVWQNIFTHRTEHKRPICAFQIARSYAGILQRTVVSCIPQPFAYLSGYTQYTLHMLHSRVYWGRLVPLSSHVLFIRHIGFSFSIVLLTLLVW